MYSNPDYGEIKEYILKYWDNTNIDDVMSFIQKGITIYQDNIEKATEIAEKFIKEERPNANEDYIKMNAPKIAQEQMRVFISTISPTALDYTINLSAYTNKKGDSNKTYYSCDLYNNPDDNKEATGGTAKPAAIQVIFSGRSRTNVI